MAAVLALTALRLAIASYTGLVDDEAYYRIWSLAPALSYLDHPPMVAWIIGAGRAIAGDTSLGVRLLAPVIVLAGAAILWRTAELLYGPVIARRAVWIMLAMPLLAIGGIIVTPDLPSVLFAGLVIWGLAELDRSQNPRWWLAIGLFAGLGLLSKYTNLFLGATIVVWLLALPENRKWFRTPELWVGGLIAAAVASPVAIWNAEHDWASFAKQFGRVARSGSAGLSLSPRTRRRLRAAGKPTNRDTRACRLRSRVTRRHSASAARATFCWRLPLPMLIYFFLHSLHDRVQGNWPGPLYPMFAICAALGIEVKCPSLGDTRRLWPRSASASP